MIVRRLARVVTTPPPAPGFIGLGHTAVEVLTSSDLPASDPFVLLMDDRLDLPTPRTIGGAHPHAGLETVTLILEGTIADRDEGALSAGDAIWMNAGRGIIHNEHVDAGGRIRILQLWIRLPASDRVMAPRFEIISGRTVPTRTEPGAVARLYSGTTGALTSPTQNRAPITLVDLRLDAGATFSQSLPSGYNGFVYAVDGAATIAGTRLSRCDVGWLDRPSGSDDSALVFVGGDAGARLVLYAGAPQHEPLLHHGPFVAGSEPELRELFYRFRRGEFTSMSSLRPDPRAEASD